MSATERLSKFTAGEYAWVRTRYKNIAVRLDSCYYKWGDFVWRVEDTERHYREAREHDLLRMSHLEQLAVLQEFARADEEFEAWRKVFAKTQIELFGETEWERVT